MIKNGTPYIPPIGETKNPGKDGKGITTIGGKFAPIKENSNELKIATWNTNDKPKKFRNKCITCRTSIYFLVFRSR